MASNTLPLQELRQLLTAVSDHGAQHLVEVEADLNQTTYLLNGAIEKLSNSFMAIHEAVTAQEQEINALLNNVDVPEAAQQNIVALREKISAEVNEAVTGLQFQDMTSQLIARVVKLINGLRESLAMLAEHGEGMAPEHEHEEIVKLLAEMSAGLNTRNDALQGEHIKSVGQQDMDSGDIELF